MSRRRCRRPWTAASLLEAQGKWLDAYTSYFYWLQAIDPNNKGYSEHAEELLDRASIAVSFQDSPCESRKERYEGVEKRMLAKAIEVLDLHYVNNIDYAQMASKAIKRCDLLAEVLRGRVRQRGRPEHGATIPDAAGAGQGDRVVGGPGRPARGGGEVGPRISTRTISSRSWTRC